MKRVKRLFASKKRVAALITGIVLVGVLGGLAYAFFTSTGTGTGNATVGTATPWLVTVGAPSGGPLLPGVGATDQTLGYTVTNQSLASQSLTSTDAFLTTDLNGFVFDVTTSTFVSGCLASWFTVGNTTVTPLPTTVAAGGSVDGTVTIHMLESGTNQDACQGISPQVTVTAS